MKKVLYKLLIFAILLLFVDFCIGYFFDNLSNINTSSNVNYIANGLNSDIVIMGSSKGERSYDPSIFKNKLGMSCYNASSAGEGIVLMYGRFLMFTQRYTPKMIIYDIKPTFDLFTNDNTRYTSFLKPFYNRKGVDSIIWKTDRTERIKMHSHIYRYNFSFLELLSSAIYPQTIGNGFIRSNVVMNYAPTKNDEYEFSKFNYDPIKLYYLEKLIIECKKKGIKLIFARAPEYFPSSFHHFQPFERLCLMYNVPYLDFSGKNPISNHRKYFIDSVHLNDAGATKYDSLLISNIKNVISAMH